MPSSNNPIQFFSPTAYEVPDLNVTQRLLVMIMDYSSCGYPASLNETSVRSLFLGADGDGSSGLAQKYTQCSYGKFSLDAAAFQAVVVKSNCTLPFDACSWWKISSAGDAGAKELLGYRVYSFTDFAYILPPAMVNICPWGGLSVLPGRQIWLQTSDYGVYRWATIFHEVMHNYGEIISLLWIHVFAHHFVCRTRATWYQTHSRP